MKYVSSVIVNATARHFLALILLLQLGGLASLAGCNEPGPATSPLPAPSAAPSVARSPVATASPGAGPAATSSLPEIPAAAPLPGGVRFKLNSPLPSGATEITGLGMPGVVLQAVDITMNGEVLGRGTIGKDNRFVIKLSAPARAGHVIGISLGTAKDAQTWLSLWALQGENARAMPEMGDFFDSVLVGAKSN